MEVDGDYLYAIFNSRGSISRYNIKTKTWELEYATAMRNAHGKGKEDSGRIWFSDNQGNYHPATPIF
ncbi:MAG: hypothetical protein M3Y08_19425 [Fibrobacterota bacterium]|nr:hypothetical protein [Fibrobacterota bacterium]